MDYVATVAFLDAGGERLDSRQYRLRSEAEPSLIAARMISDVRRALEQSPELGMVSVQDGAPEFWALIRAMLRAEPTVKGCEEVLDWYHVDERLSARLDLTFMTPEERLSQRSRWHHMLLEKSGGAESFMKSLRYFGRYIPPDSAKSFSAHVQFFAKRTKLIGYRRIRDKKLPIGSGVTEGACKSLIGTRAKRSGQNWTQRGLSAALHLRSI